jgi:hypothetical protein
VLGRQANVRAENILADHEIWYTRGARGIWQFTALQQLYPVSGLQRYVAMTYGWFMAYGFQFMAFIPIPVIAAESFESRTFAIHPCESSFPRSIFTVASGDGVCVCVWEGNNAETGLKARQNA